MIAITVNKVFYKYLIIVCCKDSLWLELHPRYCAVTMKVNDVFLCEGTVSFFKYMLFISGVKSSKGRDASVCQLILCGQNKILISLTFSLVQQE